ncbi:MAG: M56 family metallopeptidase [Saccharospirillaceae bacterium]|nr:M56 family metallopeptidase [Pseudomonadales bacterium]NRB78472.1 M56 family metallopeptidase [Saccharospirillaceae bacterium]
MNMETLIFSAIWQHLLISGVLVFSLLLLFKVIKVNAEVRSWVWLSSIMALVLVPALMIGSSNIKFVNQVDDERELETKIINSAPDSLLQVNSIGNASNNIVSDFNKQFNSNSINQNVFLIKSSRHVNPPWLVWMTNIVLNILPYLIILMVIISSIKLVWLFVQCINEYRIKYRATELVEGNVYYSNDVFVPSLVGLFQNKILLPVSVKKLSDKNRHFIVAHEQAHLMRRDQIWSFLVRLIDCVIWFSPLFYVMNNQLKHVREIACDHRAIDKMKVIKNVETSKKLKETIEIDYATMLVDCVNLFLMDKQKGEYMNLLNRKGFFRSRVNEVVNKQNDSQFKSIWLSVISCAVLLVSTSVFAANAMNNGQIIQNIDEIVDDVNIRTDISIIDSFFEEMRTDTFEIEYVYYDVGLKEYTVGIQHLEDNIVSDDFQGSRSILSEKLDNLSELNNIEISNFIIWVSIEAESIFDSVKKGGRVNGMTISFNLDKSSFDIETIKSLDDFGLYYNEFFHNDVKITDYKRSENGLFSYLSLDVLIDEHCPRRYQFGVDLHFYDFEGLLTHRISQYQDVNERCNEIGLINRNKYVLLNSASISSSDEIKLWNEISQIEDPELQSIKREDVFFNKFNDFIYYDSFLEGDLTVSQRSTHRVLSKLNNLRQKGVLVTNSESGFGIRTKVGVTENMEAFELYFNQIKSLAKYDIEMDYIVQEDNKILFLIIIDIFAIEHVLASMTESEVKALLDLKINTNVKVNFDTPPTEETKLHFQELKNLPLLTYENLEQQLKDRAIDGVKVILIETHKNSVKFRIEFDTIYLHEEFVGMLYEAYEGRIIEAGIYYGATEIGNAFLFVK